MEITIIDVAKVSGYSVSTVAKALNDNNVIKKETRDKVREVADRIGYTPNLIAKNLVKKKTEVIGLIVTDITNPFFAEFTMSVEQRAREKKYKVLLCISDNNVDLEKAYIQTFLEARVEGIIIAPIYRNDADRTHLWELKRRKVPFVLNRNIPGLEASYVCADYKKGYYEITKHLIELGHRKIALLSPFAISEVLEGYKMALDEYNIPYIGKYIIESGTGFEGGFAPAEEICKMSDKPTAILTGNDIIAFGVLQVFARYSINVPDDISLASFDDVKLASLAQIPLTTQAQPIDELGRASVDLLMDMIESKSTKCEKIILPTKLIIRKSCKRIE